MKVFNNVVGHSTSNHFALIFKQDGSFSGELTKEKIEECIGMSIEELYAHRYEFKLAIMQSQTPEPTGINYVNLLGVYSFIESEINDNIIIAGSYFQSPEGEGVLSKEFVICLHFDGTFNYAIASMS